jgi:hypothetical protein
VGHLAAPFLFCRSEAPSVQIKAQLVVPIAQVVLAPIRWLTGWRIDFDPAYHRKEEGRRLQLRLWHYLSLTFLVTLPLVLPVGYGCSMKRRKYFSPLG